jgi:hypothetical protein
MKALMEELYKWKWGDKRIRYIATNMAFYYIVKVIFRLIGRIKILCIFAYMLYCIMHKIYLRVFK